MAASIKALQQWCKIQCDGYRDVNITNMTSSFRDGLAFCALIHKHRPDLIKFDSLSKENVYDNNKLAFGVAEEKLGIPALLDAEDMVALRVPDRLSILTYVSQYYNYFHGRSPIGGMAGIKRPAEDAKEEPAGKKNSPVAGKTYPSAPVIENKPAIAKTAVPNRPAPVVTPVQPKSEEPKKVLVESTNKSGTLSSTCVVCKNHVHLVQRHLVDGKLYHRNCFRCKQCSVILLVGTYRPGPEPGTFVCTSHQNSLNKLKSATGSSVQPSPVFNSVVPTKQITPVPTPAPRQSTVLNMNLKPADVTSPAKPWSSSAEKTKAARDKFFETSPATVVSPSTNRWSTPSLPIDITDKDKARSILAKKLPIEGNNNNNATITSLGGNKTPNVQVVKAFGNNTPATETTSWKSENKTPKNSTPRPFSAIEPSFRMQTPVIEITGIKKPSEETPKKPSNISDTSGKGLTQWSTSKNTPRIMDNSISESPSDWRSKLKPVLKREAVGTIDIKNKNPTVNPNEKKSKDHSTPKVEDSLNPPPKPECPSVPKTIHVPQPPAPKKENQDTPSIKPESKTPVISPNVKVEHPKITSPEQISSPGLKSPKNRSDYIPEEKIQEELQDIEKQLDDLEKQGVELEKQLRSCEGDEKEDVLMVDWFNLIRQKQLLMRRESELVYISKTQDLEEQQPGVEEELRRLMNKPDHLKTDADRTHEAELMLKLVEIVNDRNAIIDGLDEDRLREEEEDQQLEVMMQKLDLKKDGGEKAKKSKSPITKLFRRKSKREVES
ncbi:MICAL-like protein 2a [Erpetoichthys calabaricus]|uniref:Mical-like 2a n=1 Tax=Erpetoichthys calabaricus TaxID=27687 RepID=A0A8C4SM17_ERPCA|nr:MICAL-like protein 2a [Erpetoichthys calabaricus]